MDIVTRSKINGTCEGFKKDRVFELFGGTKWRQVGEKDKAFHTKNALMQIWESNGRNYLEIVGVEQTVEVQRLVS
jgi:hypothetical protein